MLTRFKSYFFTYSYMLFDWFTFSKRKLSITISLSIFVGLLSNLPFLLAVKIASLHFSGETDLSVTYYEFSFSIPITNAVLITFLLALSIFMIQYYLRNYCLKLCMKWQRSLFVRCVGGVNNFSDPSKIMPIISSQPPILANELIKLIKASGGIERIISLGSSNLSMILVSFIIIAYLTPVFIIYITIISIVFLPLYGLTLLNMISTSKGSSKGVLAARHSLLSEITGGECKQRVSNTFGSHHVEVLYSAPTYKIMSLNAVSLISKLHLLCAVSLLLAHCYYAQVEEVNNNLLSMTSTLILFKGVIGITSLLARITRNYSNVAKLKNILYPRTKINNLTNDIVIKLEKNELQKLVPGRVFLAMFSDVDSISYQWQLAPITNALSVGREIGFDIAFLSDRSIGERDAEIVFLNRMDIDGLGSKDEIINFYHGKVILLCLTKNEQAIAKKLFSLDDEVFGVNRSGMLKKIKLKFLLQNLNKARRIIGNNPHIEDEDEL